MSPTVQPRLLVLSFLLVISFSPAIAQTEYSIGSPTNEQQFMLELINRARADGGAHATLLGLSGLQEGNPGIGGEPFVISNTAQPLSWSPVLLNAAQNHANRLEADDQFFSGQSPHEWGGTTPAGRISAAGYPMNQAQDYFGPRTTPSGFVPGPENVASARHLRAFHRPQAVCLSPGAAWALVQRHERPRPRPSTDDDAGILARGWPRDGHRQRLWPGKHLGFALHRPELRGADERDAFHYRSGLRRHERQRHL